MYVENLKKSNLIELPEVDGHEEIVLTPKAFEYLLEYERVKNFLIAFGLQDVPK